MDKCDNCWKPITDTNESILCTRCGLDCCRSCCPDGVCNDCREEDDTLFDDDEDEVEDDDADEGDEAD